MEVQSPGKGVRMHVICGSSRNKAIARSASVVKTQLAPLRCIGTSRARVVAEYTSAPESLAKVSQATGGGLQRGETAVREQKGRPHSSQNRA